MKILFSVLASIFLSSCGILDAIGLDTNIDEEPDNRFSGFYQQDIAENANTQEEREELDQEESVGYDSVDNTIGFEDYFAEGSRKQDYYNQALAFIENGERDKAINTLYALVNNFPDFKQASSLLDILESPFSTSAIAVEKYINTYLRSPSTTEPFTMEKPTLPVIPEKPILTRGEFETTTEFQQRVASETIQYKSEVENLASKYKRDVNIYNQAVIDYNKKIAWEKKSRLEKIPAMRKRYMDIAVSEVLGNPKVQELRYLPDSQQFLGKLASSNNNLLLDVLIDVPIDEAPEFKDNVDRVRPLVQIEMLEDKVVFSSMDFSYKDKMYPGELMDKISLFDPEQIQIGRREIAAKEANKSLETVVISAGEVDFNNIKLEKIIDINNIEYDEEFLIIDN